jgi:O-antigen/teichoic acid export membrane protein
MLQVFVNLKNTLGFFAWIMIGGLVISAVFLGYYFMGRLLRRRGWTTRRRLVREQRPPLGQPLPKRRTSGC